MITECSNPECGKPFHYLRGGQLYRFDVRRPVEPCRDVPNAICASKPSQASVFFWLCGDCSSRSLAPVLPARGNFSEFPGAAFPRATILW